MITNQQSKIEEMAQTLKLAFDPYFDTPKQAWFEFAELCEEIEFPKEFILKKAHESERFFYFILKGSMGVFLWKDNNPVCLDFAFENHFIGDYMSILTGAPTPLEIKTLDASTVYRISRDNYLQLGQTEIGNTLMRIAAESSFISKQQQQIDLLTKSAKQRYDELSLQFPHIEMRVAQKYLASYLGITPQSLSRLRKQV